MSKARVAVVIVAVCVLVSDCTPAPKPGPEEIAPGVVYEQFDAGVSGRRAHVHLLTADLTHPDVRVEALSAGSVVAADEPSAMAREAGAVGVINGDYFNQLGENKTNAPVGPMIIDGQPRNGGAPGRQRYGPGRPDGYDTNRDVFGIAGGRPEMSRLNVNATATTPGGQVTERCVGGLSRYARIPVPPSQRPGRHQTLVTCVNYVLDS
jgi:hypothetical protein